MTSKFMLISLMLLTFPLCLTAAPSEELRTVSGSAQIELDENTAFVANFIMDDDFGGQWTLSLEGEDASLFTLTSGQLTFTQSPNFEQPSDASHNNIYTLRVNGRDSQANPSAIDIQLIVLNVNEAPIIDVEPEHSAVEGTEFSFNLSAADEEGDSFSFSIAGDDAELFELTVTEDNAQVQPTFILNFEQPQDQDADNTYQLTVNAVDSQGNSSGSEVEFSVTNRQEIGSFSGLSPLIVYEIEASDGQRVALFNSLTWLEPDNQFAGQQISIWGHLVEDSIGLQGNLDVGLTVLEETGQVIYMDTIVAEILPEQDGKNGNTLTIRFNEATSVTSANLILTEIRYENSNILPTESRLINVELTDHEGKITRLSDSLNIVESSDYRPDFELAENSNALLTELTGASQMDIVLGYSNGQLAIFTAKSEIEESDSDEQSEHSLVDWQSTSDGALSQFDVGSNAVPAAADFDNDGDNDLIVGNDAGFVSFFNNDSLGGELTFTNKLARDNPLRFIDVGNGARPSIVDIDDDLDFDIFITNDQGELFFYENVGDVWRPEFTLVDQALLDLSLLGSELNLAFADIDADGDIDLFVGSSTEKITYYKNLGTATEPVFKSDGVLNPLASIAFDGASIPLFVDLDGDQDLDLLVQSSLDQFQAFENQSALTLSVIKRANTAPAIETPIEVNLVGNVPYLLTATVEDVEDDPLTFSWQQSSGPDAIEIRQNEQFFEFLSPEVSVAQTTEFLLTVSDGRTTSEQLFVVNVYPVGTSIPGYNQPIIELGESLTTSPGAMVFLSGVISDLDDDPLEFSWIQATGESVPIIDANTLTPSFVAPEVDQTSELEFRLVVSDGLFTVVQAITVTIEVIIEEPEVEPESTRDSNSIVALSFSTPFGLSLLFVLFRRRRVFTRQVGQ